MHIEIAVGEKRVAQRREKPRFVAVEVVGENQIEGRAHFRLVVIVPLRIVPAAAIGYLLRGQAEHKEILFSGFLGHFNGRAVPRMPIVAPPFIMNFMLLVPLAS